MGLTKVPGSPSVANDIFDELEKANVIWTIFLVTHRLFW